MKSFIKCRAGIVCALPFLAMTLTLPALSQTTERVSVASGGRQGNGLSQNPSISGGGRYVAFESFASNLVSGDTNHESDVFVHDRTTGVTRRVSVASDGSQGNSVSFSPSISTNGRYVAFASDASNLVSGDSNGRLDVFVHDRTTGMTRRVSVGSGGAQGNGPSDFPSISANGRYVAFESGDSNLVPDDINGKYDIIVHDRSTGVTERVSVSTDGVQGNDHSYHSSISVGGLYVAFMSWSTNLTSGDSNGEIDVFVRDRTTGVTTRVSVGSAGAQSNGTSQNPSISAGGRYMAFESGARPC